MEAGLCDEVETRFAGWSPGRYARPASSGRPSQAVAIRRRPRLMDDPNARRRRNSELARRRRDAVTWAGPVVVDDFPREIPITRRELDVIETYLGTILDDALGVPE